MFEFQLGREAPDEDKEAIVAFIKTLAGEYQENNYQLDLGQGSMSAEFQEDSRNGNLGRRPGAGGVQEISTGEAAQESPPADIAETVSETEKPARCVRAAQPEKHRKAEKLPARFVQAAKSHGSH